MHQTSPFSRSPVIFSLLHFPLPSSVSPSHSLHESSQRAATAATNTVGQRRRAYEWPSVSGGVGTERGWRARERRDRGRRGCSSPRPRGQRPPAVATLATTEVSGLSSASALARAFSRGHGRRWWSLARGHAADGACYSANGRCGPGGRWSQMLASADARVSCVAGGSLEILSHPETVSPFISCLLDKSNVTLNFYIAFNIMIIDL
jgi:hypothetical protein